MLSVLALTVIISAPIAHKAKHTMSIDEIIEGISYSQHLAVKENDYYDYENDDEQIDIIFNRKGSVMHAETIYVTRGRIIISLGTGRVYEKP